MLTNQPLLIEHEHGDCRIDCLVTGVEWKQNTYIVTHRSALNTIVVDPGGEAAFIIKHIEEIGGRVTHIFLTHPHHDHVGAVSQLSAHYDLACELHKEDVRLLMQAPMYALTFAKKRMDAISRFQEFEELSLYNDAPRVHSLHTPGHTKGSSCYLFEGFVFTGDTLLFRSIGRTDLPGGSLPALKASITTLLAELPDDAMIFPGHGKPWESGDAKDWWHEVAASPPQHDQFITG